MDTLSQEQIKLIQDTVTSEMQKTIQGILNQLEYINDKLTRMEVDQRNMRHRLADSSMRVESMNRASKYKIMPYVDDTIDGKPISPFAQ